MQASSSQRVCVTGATGYVASHVVLALLKKGYTVVGTVRDLADTAKNEFLLRLAADIGASSRLTLSEANLLIPGSFNKALDGCACVIHMASPFREKVSDPQKELVDPALKGTENVLSSVPQHPSIKRVVLTSSVAAIYGDIADKKDHVYTEEDWNETSSVDHQAYHYSKTLAERRAWELAGQQSQYSLVVINPSFVMGPMLSDRESSQSITFMREMLSGKMRPGVPHHEYGFVDVRDVADAHVAAMERTEAKGRHICSKQTMDALEVAQILKERFPNNPLPSFEIPKPLMYVLGPLQGQDLTGVHKSIGHHLAFDNSKIQRDLGILFPRPLRDTFLEMADSLVAAGLVERM